MRLQPTKTQHKKLEFRRMLEDKGATSAYVQDAGGVE
jgi:hypothetical protein